MNHGVVQQVETQEHLRRPRNLVVAGSPSMNRINGSSADGRLQLEAQLIASRSIKPIGYRYTDTRRIRR
jgi:ABC-type sugar transport system ATPase subunit